MSPKTVGVSCTASIVSVRYPYRAQLLQGGDHVVSLGAIGRVLVQLVKFLIVR